MNLTTIQPKSYGFLPNEDKPEDFIFGAERSLDTKFAGRPVLAPDSDWSKWLPLTEPQNVTYETNGCVTFGTLNIIEALKKRLYDNNDNLSDRFVIVGSKTDPNGGNTPINVGEFIRQNWSVFENEYPFSAKSVEDFYKKIPNAIFSLAIERGLEYEFGYENVPLENVREALKYSPIGMSVAAWNQDKDGLYYRPNGMLDNHYVMCYGIKDNGNFEVFDSYYPYLKEVRADMKPMNRMGYHLALVPLNRPAWLKFLNNLYQSFLNLFHV